MFSQVVWLIGFTNIVWLIGFTNITSSVIDTIHQYQHVGMFISVTNPHNIRIMNTFVHHGPCSEQHVQLVCGIWLSGHFNWSWWSCTTFESKPSDICTCIYSHHSIIFRKSTQNIANFVKSLWIHRAGVTLWSSMLHVPVMFETYAVIKIAGKFKHHFYDIDLFFKKRGRQLLEGH